ncbi:hypothetical protein HAX54_010727 [Datura stramonium]|uniref:Uncharacterized protein n=1 Tax=Datura stramonium TaxID=4076 RepID=A0ABS8TJH7_DATST|nr:hypothetical protein [Datura stramonium]
MPGVPFTRYAILDDDIVIGDERVAERYHELISLKIPHNKIGGRKVSGEILIQKSDSWRKIDGILRSGPPSPTTTSHFLWLPTVSGSTHGSPVTSVFSSSATAVSSGDLALSSLVIGAHVVGLFLGPFLLRKNHGQIFSASPRVQPDFVQLENRGHNHWTVEYK